MGTQAQDMETINVTIEQTKEAIDIRNMVIRLTKNQDFSTIVEKGYFQEEASRLTLLLADPNTQTPEIQEQIIKDLNSIGRFRQYLGARINAGNMAEKALSDHEAARQEIAEEE